MFGRLVPGAILIASISFATPIPIGLIAFDNLIPDTGSGGVNVVSIQNLTGDPGSGGYGLSQDFPAFSPLRFRDLKLTISIAGSTASFDLPDLDGGSLTGVSALQFSTSEALDWVSLTGTLLDTKTRLEPSGETTYVSPTFNVGLFPTTATTLQAGVDFAVIEATTVPPQSVVIPEPSTLLGAALGVGLLLARTRR